MTTVITDSLLAQYDITLEKLHEIAIQNMVTKARFCNMFEILSELMSDSLPQDEFCPADNMMFVLTNESKLNGAAMLLCPETMDKIAELVGSSYYILPSSIHETLPSLILLIPVPFILCITTISNLYYLFCLNQIC